MQVHDRTSDVVFTIFAIDKVFLNTAQRCLDLSNHTLKFLSFFLFTSFTSMYDVCVSLSVCFLDENLVIGKSETPDLRDVVVAGVVGSDQQEGGALHHQRALQPA